MAADHTKFEDVQQQGPSGVSGTPVLDRMSATPPLPNLQLQRSGLAQVAPAGELDLDALFAAQAVDLIAEVSPVQPMAARLGDSGDLPAELTEQAAWRCLEGVADPEIPVVSVVELGIVRELSLIELAQADDAGTAAAGPTIGVDVVVTPTYSGCPATAVIGRSIERALLQLGFAQVRVSTRLAPAWSTDWIAPQARDRLRSFGITPPQAGAIDVSALGQHRDDAAQPDIPCPRCGATRTRLVSAFGSTPCKALYRCMACAEPFDYFKPH